MTGPRVAVITLTFRRPDDLRAALPTLVDAMGDRPATELLVVDNDVVPSARSIVTEFGDERVRYVHEPSPGIAAARNRGLTETADSDFVIFIDDDERPQSGWLGSLLAVQRSTGAQAVAGPVISEFPGELDPWIVAGQYFVRLRHETGVELEVAATNNLLLDRQFVERHRLRFDEAFGLSGGSDSVFTRQLVRVGGRMVWCDEAAVTDVVPPARATRGWVTRRAFRMGNTEARARIHVATTPAERLAERARAVAQGGSRVAAGLAQVIKGVTMQRLPDRARGQRKALRGAGMALAAIGYSYVEYRRKHDK